MLQLRVFVVILVFFTAWSVAKPPMQAADEFSHTARVETIPDNLWFSHGERLHGPADRVNPYINSARLRELPFHPDRKLSDLEIAALKEYEWGKEGSVVEVLTVSHSYAPGYFGPEYIIGRTVTEALSLAPFESNWVYRFVSCLFCSALFTYFVLLLRTTFPKYWIPMSVLCVVNPQIGFTLSSIHPDSLFTPAAAITSLLAYRSCLGLGSFPNFKLAIFATMAIFAKPLGTPMCLALVATTVFFGAIFKAARANSIRCATALFSALIISQLTYFAWVKLEIYGIPISLNVWEYISVLPDKPRIWFKQFFGAVGWLDTSINSPWHEILLVCLAVNFILAALHAVKTKEIRPWMYFGVLGVIFITGLLVGEFRYLEKAGYSIQGRYLFPLLPLVALIMVHNVQTIRRASILFLVVYCLAYYNYSVHRYFMTGWQGWEHNLPFWRANEISIAKPIQVAPLASGTAPKDMYTEGPMISFQMTSSTEPAIRVNSTPNPKLTELLQLPQPDLWRISILYSSQSDALSAAKNLVSE